MLFHGGNSAYSVAPTLAGGPKANCWGPGAAMKTCSTAGTRLESNPHAQLGGEGNPYRGTWAEEVSQAAGGDLQLLEAGDGPELAR